MTIGERIRKIRIEKGMTQKQVAEACGMADSAIRKYESGKQKPKMETIFRLSEALDVSPSILAGIDPLIDSPEQRKDIDDGIAYIYNDAKYYYKSGGSTRWRKPTLDEIAGLLERKPDIIDLLIMYFYDLNETGQRIAVERVQELSKIAEYQCECGNNDDYARAQRAIHGDILTKEEGDANVVDPENE